MAEVHRYQYDEHYSFLKGSLEDAHNLPKNVLRLVRSLREIYGPLNLRPGDRVLDVGCNIGSLGHFLQYGGVLMVGIDINYAALRHGRGLYDSQVNFTQAEACQLPFPDNTFDALVSEDLLEHLNSPEETLMAFQEMTRVCKGSRMVQKVTVLEDSKWIHADPSHRVKQSVEWWKNLFSNHGWQTISPTTKTYAVTPSRNGFTRHQMHGYFLLERCTSA